MFAAASLLVVDGAGGERAGSGVPARGSQGSGSAPGEARRAAAPEKQNERPHRHAAPSGELCRADRLLSGHVREGTFVSMCES